MHYMVTVDVPELEAGLWFYRDALGLPEVARPIPTYVILQCGPSRLGLMEKAAGSQPAPGSTDVRRYGRHWTPVHLDFHVDDFEGALARVLAAGATCEQKHAGGEHAPIAFCSDPFGHGFCIVGNHK